MQVDYAAALLQTEKMIQELDGFDFRHYFGEAHTFDICHLEEGKGAFDLIDAALIKLQQRKQELINKLAK